MNFKKYIPNALTCCNLLCGCIAIVQAFEGNLVLTSYLVGLAAIFDFFDGFAARLLRVVSPIGKDLDSLADMVTFGVVPGIVMFQLLQMGISLSMSEQVMSLTAAQQGTYSQSWFQTCLKYVSFIIPVFSAIRLAKFNNDNRQTTSFIGLPTPANAIFICSIPLIIGSDVLHTMTALIQSPLNFVSDRLDQTPLIIEQIHILLNPALLAAISIILSFLLISELPLFALKFKSFSWLGNRTRYLFLIFSVLLLILFKYIGIPLIIVMYIMMSVNSNFFAKRKNTVKS